MASLESATQRSQTILSWNATLTAVASTNPIAAAYTHSAEHAASTVRRQMAAATAAVALSPAILLDIMMGIFVKMCEWGERGIIVE